MNVQCICVLNNSGCVQLLVSQGNSSFHLSLTFKTCSLHLHPSPLLLLYLAHRGRETQREREKSRKAKRGRQREKGRGGPGLLLLLSGLYYYLLGACSMKSRPCECVHVCARVSVRVPVCQQGKHSVCCKKMSVIAVTLLSFKHN